MKDQPALVSNLPTMRAADPGSQVAAATDAFASDVRYGLGLPRRKLNCKYFYDERGSALFEQICELDEYYLTRTEMQIMQQQVGEIAAVMGRKVALIELGSGAAVKTRMLLDHLQEPSAYVPVDIAAEQLEIVSQAIARDYPHLQVAPLCADFTAQFRLPDLASEHRWFVYFPGSTIGNFEPRHAKIFLAQLHEIVGAGGGLLIGVDLKKDPAVLHGAYNDAAGITAQFNLNLLHRINRELDGRFDPNAFAHYAFYNPNHSRIEMHLVSLRRQVVSAAGQHYEFKAGESIFTESSYKHDPYEFARLAQSAGFDLHRMWLDDQRWFTIQLFRAI